jgi:hypothetical protein
LDIQQHPLLRTLEDCREFVQRELDGTGVRVL